MCLNLRRRRDGSTSNPALEMDWSMDAELPQRFKVWKRQVTGELRLQMAEDPYKQQLWACTYITVCAGVQGEHVIPQAQLERRPYEDTRCHRRIRITVMPLCGRRFNYFYLKQ